MQQQTALALKEGRWAAAIGLLEQELVEENPEAGTVAYNLCVAYLKLNKYQEAEQIVQRYITQMRDLPSQDIEQIRKEIKQMKPHQPRKPKDESKTVSVDGQIKSMGWFTSTTKFSDVIGLKKAKAELNEKVIGAMQNPELYARYGAATKGGIILYGPPGTGKTLLARASAGEAGGQMLLAHTKDIISKFMGDSNKNFSTLFDEARKKSPAMIFIDEIDGAAQKRESAGESMTTGPEERRIIEGFLTEMDGIGKNNKGVFVLGASNIPWAIDEAFLRNGRFGKKIYVGSPNTKDRVAMFRFYLKNKKIKKISYWKLGLLTFGMTGADIAAITENAATRKAALTHFNKAEETPITTMQLISQIRAIGKPTLLSWYAQTSLELKKQPAETANQYAELQKDIAFWEKNGKIRIIMYKIIASLIPALS